jgi:AcrR family transcriptional regulator
LTTIAREPVIKTKKVGVREKSKRERQDRIMMAARNMFAEHGYDATTLRQVAERAGLGLGTLFNYISDKRDLIYLVFNQEASVACDASLVAPRPWQSFTEKILGMVEPNYRLFGSEPVLSRILLSEVLQHTPGFHLAEHIAIRDRFIRGMEDVVTEAQQSGEIASTESAQLIARHIFFSYSAALRWWLSASENPEWRAGLREFAEILKLQTTGLNLRSDAERTAKPLTLVASSGVRSKTTRQATGGTLAPRIPKTKRARALQKA